MCLLSPLLFNIIPEVLANAGKTRKEIIGISFKEGKVKTEMT
jgi:hypothetical protein